MATASSLFNLMFIINSGQPLISLCSPLAIKKTMNETGYASNTDPDDVKK